jgi:thioredoxin reductase (NADPH)
MLVGEPAFYTAVVRQPGEVLVIGVDRLRERVGQDPALGELVLRAFLQRREILIGLGAGLRIVGSRYSAETRRLLEFCARNRLPHRWIDLEDDVAAEALLAELHVRPEETPIVIYGGTRMLRNPTNAELAEALGLRRADRPRDVCDLVVVGAGPAGLAASVYGASEGLTTVTLESVAAGGQAGTSSRIENYLGFPSGISGAELAERARIQAEKFGATITVPTEATALERRDGHHAIRLDDGGEIEARTVVIATGARYRKLPVPGLDRFEATSVFYAATLMEARMCAGDPVAVVGGANSAGQGALFLARHTARVRLLVRHDDLLRDMSRYLADRIVRDPNIEVLLHTDVREAVGDDALEGLVVEDTHSGERRTIDARALFVFIGAQPHTQWLGDELALDRRGFVLTGPDAARAISGGDRDEPWRELLLLETSRPGVLAVGDVRYGSIKRMASAVGEGSMAVRLVFEHLTRRGGSAAGAQHDGAHPERVQTKVSST